VSKARLIYVAVFALLIVNVLLALLPALMGPEGPHDGAEI
jgi:hypothetical protein